MRVKAYVSAGEAAKFRQEVAEGKDLVNLMVWVNRKYPTTTTHELEIIGFREVGPDGKVVSKLKKFVIAVKRAIRAFREAMK